MRSISGLIDKCAILGSGICLLHCVFLPLVIVFLPWAPGFLQSDNFHVLMLTFLVPMACYALISGYKIHKKSSPLCLGIPGMAFIAAGLASSMLGAEKYDTVLTVIGSIFLITAHFTNMKHNKGIKHCRCCKHNI